MKSKRAREAAEVDETPIDEVAEAPAKKRKRGGDDDGVKKGKKKDKELKQEEADIDGAEEKPKKKKKEDKYKREKESRRERKDRKKDLLNLPGDEGEDEEMKEEVEAVNGSEEKKQTKKEKSEAVTGEKKEKKEKKAKKDKKKPKVDDTTPATATTNGEANGIKSEEQPDTNGTDAIDLDASTAEKQDRHIVFVGNLPYTATAASISAHFVSLAPIAVRCLKNKGDDKPCRGIAFVEFGRASHMRTCLDKFHHSEFNDGVSAARKINVELTAGGGGKTKQRQEKIRAKNEKLDENRTKRIEKEKQTKDEAAGKAGQQQQSNWEDSIHPSRRGRVPGMAY